MIYTVSLGNIALFVKKVTHQKKYTNNFLQNEANIAALKAGIF
jgi:hypothetical protein